MWRNARKATTEGCQEEKETGQFLFFALCLRRRDVVLIFNVLHAAASVAFGWTRPTSSKFEWDAVCHCWKLGLPPCCTGSSGGNARMGLGAQGASLWDATKPFPPWRCSWGGCHPCVPLGLGSPCMLVRNWRDLGRLNHLPVEHRAHLLLLVPLCSQAPRL